MSCFGCAFCLERGRVPVVLLLAVLAASCGKQRPQRLPVYPVQGQVFLDGRPAAGAAVIFHPLTREAGPVHPVAHAGPDGTFRPTTYVTGDGCPAGDYALAVSITSEAGASESDTGIPLVVLSPPRYADPKTSGLRVTVEAKANDLPPLRLSR